MQISRRRLIGSLPVLGMASGVFAAEGFDGGELEWSPAEAARLDRRANGVIREARVLLELPLAGHAPALGYRPKVIQKPGFADVRPSTESATRSTTKRTSNGRRRRLDRRLRTDLGIGRSWTV